MVISIDELNDIGDVNAPTPSDGEALVWDNGTSKWIPAAPAPEAHDLAGALHNADTLADLNNKVSDATLVDTASITLKALFDANTILAANSDNTPAALAVAASRFLGRKAAGNIAAMTVAEAITLLALDSTIVFIIDGGGSAITTGIKGDLVVDFPCTIKSVTMLADQSGSIVVDIWKDTYANFPPIDGDSITSSAVPTISGATKSQDATLTGWTTSIAAGDILRFNVDSVATIERLTITLKVTRT